MATGNFSLLSFNRGIVSEYGLARIDLERMALSAEIQTNWMPRVLGSMMLRAGWEYNQATRDNLQSYTIPFIYSTSQQARLEFTNFGMRAIVDDVVVSRPSVTTTITNDTFTTNLTGWTDNDEAGAVSQWRAGGYMELTGTGAKAAIRDQMVTVAGGNIGVEHALNIVVNRGQVILRVGSTVGGQEYINETILRVGTHSIAFIPTGNFNIRLFARATAPVLVDSCTLEVAGDMVVTSPWPTSALKSIRFSQSNDVIFIACNGYQNKRIERRSQRSWSICNYDPIDGPFNLVNTAATTITASAINGNVTLTASNKLFQSSNVGGLFKLTSTGQTVSSNISGDNTFTNSIIVTGIGVSRQFTISLTGVWVALLTLQRSYDEGASWLDVTAYAANTTIAFNDGLDNQEIRYRIGIKTGDYTSGTVVATLAYAQGFITGFVRITNYTNETTVLADVLSDLGGTTAITEWAEGVWSDKNGWPSAVTLYEGRVAWPGLGKFIATISDTVDSFDESVEGDSGAINKSLGSGPVNDVFWSLELQRLVMGCQLAEKSARSNSFDEPITPTNCNIKPSSTQGSCNVDAVKVDNRGIFVDLSNTALYDLIYNADGNFDYQPNELTILCPEILATGVVRIAVQRKPDTRIHCVLADGTVAVFVESKTEKVLAPILLTSIGAEGIVEDVCVLPCVAGEKEDRVYYTVQRTINNSVVRYHERQALETECQGGTLNKQADAFKLISQASSTIITGLSHLEGALVVVWANGKDLGTYTVASGSITVTEAVTSAIVGLGYTAQFKSSKLAYAASLGTALIQKKKVSHIGFILKNTHKAGIRYGRDFDNLDDLPAVEDWDETSADYVWDNYDKDSFPFPGEYNTDTRICLEAAAPRPATILAAIFTLSTYDKS